MRGQILDFAVKTNTGVISAENGERFDFLGSDWNGDRAPARGEWVDFKVSDGKAADIYRALAKGIKGESEKSKSTITLLALFLGSCGAHKFYMGSWGWGIVYLLTFWWLFVPIIVSLVEAVRYIQMTDEEFHIKASSFQKAPFAFFW